MEFYVGQSEIIIKCVIHTFTSIHVCEQGEKIYFICIYPLLLILLTHLCACVVCVCVCMHTLT